MFVVYIAGPFRGKTAWEIAQNVRRAEEAALEVARAGMMPLCPHTNTAHFLWLDGTMELLRRCDGVLLVNGWERSEGAKAEKLEAEKLGLPVACWPGDLKVALLKKKGTP